MAKEIKCPLCGDNHIEFVERIITNDIVQLWNKQKVDISKLFDGITYLNKMGCSGCGLEFFDPFVSGDNEFYSALGKEEWYYLHEDKTEFLYSNQYIKDGDSVLDIGSGRGAFVKYIDKRISYTGLELSSKAVEFAQNENINVIEQTIEEFSKENKSNQDVVVTFQVLEHITDIDSFINSSLLTLKQDGLFIIAVPNNESFIKDCQNHLLNLPPHHLLHWNEKSLKYLAGKYNLQIIDIYKEKLTNVHTKWHNHIKLSKLIHHLLGFKMQSINTSFATKMISKISSIILKFPIFKNNINSENTGMTIAIILKKA